MEDIKYDILKSFNNYNDKVKFDSSGKWCKWIKGKDGDWGHPEHYNYVEFTRKIENDLEFREKWCIYYE